MQNQLLVPNLIENELVKTKDKKYEKQKRKIIIKETKSSLYINKEFKQEKL